MKALQLRSPLHLYYNLTNLDSVRLKIFVNSDPTAIDTTATPDYDLVGTAISEELTFEVAELVRSKNQYLYESDFYTSRDTAIYVLIQAILSNDTPTELETRYNFLRVRDGYIERNEPIQILKTEVTPKIDTWTDTADYTITDGVSDPFGGTDAYELVSIGDGKEISQIVSLSGYYTFSVWVKYVSGGSEVGIRNTSLNRVTFSLLLSAVIGDSAGDFIAFDAVVLGGWFKISAVMNNPTEFRLRCNLSGTLQYFNPTLIKGNLLNQTATDLTLQDNFIIYSHSSITPQITLDRKLSSGTTYLYGILDLATSFESDVTLQSIATDVLSKSDVEYRQLDATDTTQEVELIELCEPKFTPTKLSFLNRYGVIQDVVFFKKRVNNINTNDQQYKANVLRNGTVLSHVGQKQILNKTSEGKVTLNSGFYPENFNGIFEQIINSIYYWIDDEPAILTTSNWTEKTSVNDKLINYTFEFEYSNNEINNIR